MVSRPVDPLVCAVSLTFCAGLAAPVAAQFGPALVVTAPVEEREIASQKQFVATVEPLRMSIVGSAVEGRVMELAVDEGDRVTKGQMLAQLRTRTIEAELAAARSELALRAAELAEMENGSRPEEIAQAKAAMLADQARMEYAKKDLARIQRLYQGQTAADDEHDEAISLATEREQDYLEAAAAYEMAVQGPRVERIAQARARRDQAQSVVERLEDILTKYTVNAPFDGYVSAKRTEVGAWIMSGDPVVEVVELRQVDVVALIPEDYVNALTLGMTATVRVSSLNGREFTGQIAAIVPQADRQSRSFPVKVRVENPETEGPPPLKWGMLAEVSVSVGEPRKVLLIPKDAVVLGGPTPMVYVFSPAAADPTTGTVRGVPVKLGLSTGPQVEVEGELTAGEHAIVRGNERLMPGQSVKLAEVRG